MKKEKFNEIVDAADKVCIQCVEYIDEFGNPDSSICDYCPVRKTLDRLHEIIEKEKIYYYEFFFAVSDELLSEGWYTFDDDGKQLSQTFYGKSNIKLRTFEQAREYLRKTFPVTDKLNTNLVNCLNEHTIQQMNCFDEISADEFESCCGCTA